MSVKAVLIFCAHALFAQSALSQCTSRAAVADHADIGYGLRVPYGYGLEAPWCLDGGYALEAPWGLDGGYGYGGWSCGSAIEYSPTSGGGLPVSSASAIAPIGISVASENEYKGQLAAAGELPFVGTIGVEGVLPTTGAGAINHHCGDGINAMVSDKTSFDAYAPRYTGAFAPTMAAAMTPAMAPAYDLGFVGPALGYRAGWPGKSCGCVY